MSEQLAPMLWQQFSNSNGAPLSGGLLYSYQAGTTTPIATYTDSTGNTANTNPVVLDTYGSAPVWLANANYKFVLQDSLGNPIRTVDNVQGNTGGTVAGNPTWGAIVGTLSSQSDLVSALALKSNLASPTFTGTVTSPAFSGPITGNVTGNVTGNLTGNVTGNASGTSATFTGNLTGDVTSTGMATTVGKINGTSLGGLATGILKNTTTTGVPSIAVAGDFPTLNQNTSGSSGSVSGTNVVTNSNLSQMASNTIKGNNTGGTANAADLTVAQVNAILPVFTSSLNGAAPSSGGGTTNYLRADGTWSAPSAGAGGTSTPTANTNSQWDTSVNMSANNFIEAFTTTATAASTTTMTVTSTFIQVWTGSTTQTVKLPTTSIVAGQQYLIENRSTGVVTVQSSGANTIQAMASNTQLLVTALVATPTTAANWDGVYSAIGTVPLALGGTGSITAAAAMTAISPITTTGDIIYSSSGTTNSRLAIGSAGQRLTTVNGIPAWLIQSLGDLTNAALATSVATNAMTVTLQTNAAANPAAAGPVFLTARNSTATTGTSNLRAATAATSVIIASGATLGLVSAQNQYIYVYLLDNAGTLELAVSGSKIWDEGTLQNTTAIGAGSTSSVVLYSTTARTGVPIRLIGRLKSNQTTSGTYAANATEISMVPFQNITPKSQIRLSQGNGYGSTNTCYTRWTNTDQSIGSDITYTDSATLGGSFTINTDGLYAIEYSDYINQAGQVSLEVAITLNDNQGTTAPDSSTAANTLVAAQTTVPAGGPAASISTVKWLSAGSVINAKSDGNVGRGTTQAWQQKFNITRIA